jgi:hypothetical protein
VVFAGVRNIESSKHLQPLLSRSNIHAVKLDMTDIKSLEVCDHTSTLRMILSSENHQSAAEEVAKVTGGTLDVYVNL